MLYASLNLNNSLYKTLHLFQVLFALYFWQEFSGEDITFPTDEIWLYDLDRGSW